MLILHTPTTLPALAIRVDALGDQVEASIGYENRAKVEARLRQLQSGGAMSVGEAGGSAKYDAAAAATGASGAGYSGAADVTISDAADEGEGKKKKKDKKEKKDKKDKKRKREDDGEEKKKKKKKKDKK